MSENQAADSDQPQFNVRTLYLKDVSFESPQSPAIFTAADFNPEIDVQMNVDKQTLNEAEGFHEVVLKVTVVAKYKEEDVFLCEVHQAGVFLIVNVSEDDLERALEIGCPNILLPFARQAISSLVVQGGFPQLLLSPVNFEAVYEQRRATKQ